MKKRDLLATCDFKILNEGNDLDAEVLTPFCCDLLSIAMSKVPAGAAWVTVMGNLNTLAVATLTEATCVILAEGVTLDEAALKKAESEGVTILETDLPIFLAALRVYQLIHGVA